MQEQILSKFFSGESQKSISVSLGCSVWTVRNVIEKFSKFEGLYEPTADDPKILDMYRARQSVATISASLGIPPKKIVHCLKDYGLFCRQRKYFFDDSLFEKIDSEWKAYLLGLLFADGCNQKNNLIALKLHEKDRDVIEKLNNWIFHGTNPIRLEPARTYMGKDGKPRNNAAKYFFTINSKKACEDLAKLGCGQRKSLTLGMPNLHPEYMRHFLRGYFDGDGTISDRESTKRNTNNKRSTILSVVSSDRFCLELFDYLSRLGIHPKLIKYNAISRVSFYRRGEIKWFHDYFYKDATIYLERKKNGFLPFL